MVRFLSASNSCGVSIGFEALGDKRENPLTRMTFANPAAVGWKGGKHTVQAPRGFRVVAEAAPKRPHRQGGGPALPDVDVPGGMIAVRRRSRDPAERFEPCVHQFIPMDVHEDLKAAPATAACFRFNACACPASVGPERAACARQPNREDALYKTAVVNVDSRYVPASGPEPVLGRERVGAHHLWIDPCISVAGCMYAPDAFGAAALAEGSAGLDARRGGEA